MGTVALAGGGLIRLDAEDAISDRLDHIQRGTHR